MDLIRLFMLSGGFLSAMLAGLYASGGELADQPGPSTPVAELVTADTTEPAVLADPPSLPSGRDIPADALEEQDDTEVFVDPSTGVAMGPVALRVSTRRSPAPELSEPARSSPAVRPSTAARTRRASPPRVPMPRLDQDPGRHVILTARSMMARGETVQGSCYAYLSEVFDRAGHDGWRTRAVIHQAGPRGPYADLDLIRPGDWLYIVNNPDSTPVGTHSVLFVGWEDRASGYARTISHAGWAAGASPGRESSYDITRTYRIIRPRLAQ